MNKTNFTSEETDMRHRMVPRYVPTPEEAKIDLIFDAIFHHHITRSHNMTGRECKDIARAVYRAQKEEAK